MSRAAAPVVLFSTVLSLMASVHSPKAQASGIPDYFFNVWTVSRDCTEQHAGPRGHTTPGQAFRVLRNSADGVSYSLVPLNRLGGADRAWRSVKLEYRPGVRMTSIPADMECVPGQEASSPFLALSGFSQNAEPYYAYEHWYGTIVLHGEVHHLLIFPRDTRGPSSAAIVLADADAGGNLQLDSNGTIIVEN